MDRLKIVLLTSFLSFNLQASDMSFMDACKNDNTVVMRERLREEAEYKAKTNTFVLLTKSLMGYQDHIYQTNHLWESPLHIAAYHGNLEAAKLLVESKADLAWKNRMGFTALHVAASKGHTEVVRLLIEHGAKIDQKTTKEGFTALHIALYNEHKDIIDLLTKKDADKSKDTIYKKVKSIFSSPYVDKAAKNGFFPLYTSAEIGDIESVKYFLAQNADIKKTDLKGMNPLHIAVQNGHLDIVKLLAMKGKGLFTNFVGTDHLYINQADKNGFTPLYLAIKSVRQDMIDFLKSAGANLHQTNAAGETFLHLAAKHGHTNVIRYLHDIGAADMIKTNKSGETALYLAAKHGAMESFNTIKGLGASLTAITSKGDTYLHIAAQKGDTAALQVFLDHGLNKDVVNLKGNTPLHIAAKTDQALAATILIENGADMEKENISKITPLMLAIQNTSLESARVLIGKMDYTKLSPDMTKKIAGNKRLWGYLGTHLGATRN